MKVKLLILAVLCGMLFGGCATVGMMSNNDVYQGRDKLVLAKPAPGVVDKIAEVGKSMGYKVSGSDEQSIRLTSQSSAASTMFIGKYNMSILMFTVKEDNKNIDMFIQLQGNLGGASKEKAEEIIAEFKSRLAERMKE